MKYYRPYAFVLSIQFDLIYSSELYQRFRFKWIRIIIMTIEKFLFMFWYLYDIASSLLWSFILDREWLEAISNGSWLSWLRSWININIRLVINIMIFRELKNVVKILYIVTEFFNWKYVINIRLVPYRHWNVDENWI